MAIPQQQKKYLKVETPVTTDGKTLAYDENRQPIMKTTYLPITAKVELLRNTSKLPEYLRPTITEMSGDADALANTVVEQKAAKAERNAESAVAEVKATPATKPRSRSRSAAKKAE